MIQTCSHTTIKPALLEKPFNKEKACAEQQCYNNLFKTLIPTNLLSQILASSPNPYSRIHTISDQSSLPKKVIAQSLGLLTLDTISNNEELEKVRQAFWRGSYYYYRSHKPSTSKPEHRLGSLIDDLMKLLSELEGTDLQAVCKVLAKLKLYPEAIQLINNRCSFEDTLKSLQDVALIAAEHGNSAQAKTAISFMNNKHWQTSTLRQASKILDKKQFMLQAAKESLTLSSSKIDKSTEFFEFCCLDKVENNQINTEINKLRDQAKKGTIEDAKKRCSKIFVKAFGKSWKIWDGDGFKRTCYSKILSQIAVIQANNGNIKGGIETACSAPDVNGYVAQALSKIAKIQISNGKIEEAKKTVLRISSGLFYGLYHFRALKAIAIAQMNREDVNGAMETVKLCLSRESREMVLDSIFDALISKITEEISINFYIDHKKIDSDHLKTR